MCLGLSNAGEESMQLRPGFGNKDELEAGSLGHPCHGCWNRPHDLYVAMWGVVFDFYLIEQMPFALL